MAGHRLGPGGPCIVGQLEPLKGIFHAEIRHPAIRGSELHMVPEVGHAIARGAPASFNKIVLGFVGRH